MARLTTASRKKLKSSQFGLPSKRSKSGGKGGYPVEDKAHARNAKARASQQYNRGNLTASQKARIDSKANKVLGKSRKKGK